MPKKSGVSNHLLRKTEQSLSKMRPDGDGRVRGRDDVLHITVTPTSPQRAIGIMSRVLQEAEKMGYWVQAFRDGRRSLTILDVRGEQIEFSMTEQTHQKLNPKWGGKFLSEEPQYLYTNTGVLSLEINSFGDEGQRRRWRDTKRHRLEDCIGAFLEGVESTAETCKRRKAEWAREREKEQKEEVAEAARIEVLHRELERFDALVAEAKAWETSRLIRDYVQAMRAGAVESGEDTGPGSEFAIWAEWAEKKASEYRLSVKTPGEGDSLYRPKS